MKQLSVSFWVVLFFLTISCSKDDSIAEIDKSTSEQQKVFKEYWEIYDRHYPLFHRKNIDWKEVYDTYYPKITSTTTDQELYEVFKTIMTTIIKDGHTDVEYNKSKSISYEPEMSEQVKNMIDKNTAGKVRLVGSSAKNPYLSYGTLLADPNIGYIQSKQFEPVKDSDGEFKNFKAIVDKALTALKNKKGIIIDIRTNGGGQGPYAYYLAGRFFSTTTPIELVRQRIKTKTGSTVASLGEWATKEFRGYKDARVKDGGYVAGVFPEEYTIKASGSFQFTKKVAVLTSKSTASAAEFFTAAMKTQSHVKTFGETTFGIFAGSDIFTLNNGKGKWKTRVSTHDAEVKYNNVFRSFEGIGIEPDQVLIPTAAQVKSGADIHIEEASKYIN